MEVKKALVSPVRLILFSFVFLYYSCNPKNKITDLSVDIENAMRANITFNTTLKSQCVIEYWEENTDRIQRSKYSGIEKAHKITLLFLKPNTIYSYKIISRYKEGVTEIDHKLFKTSTLSLELPELDLIVDEGEVFDGYLLVRKVRPSGTQMLIDHKGKIVWYHKFDTVVFRPYQWTGKGTIIALEYENHITEIDLGGNLIFDLEYGEKGFTKLLHHEILRDYLGNILALSRNNKVFDLSGVGGAKTDTVKGDGILVLDSVGNKIWEWDIFEYSDPDEDTNILETKDDWSHANSLGIDKNGNYLVSFRHFDQIWCIDSNSGEVLWKLGKGGDFELQPDDIFIKQHAAHINPFGELMLFDNGDFDRRYSRAVSYDLNTESFIASSKIKVKLPDSLFSVKQGSAYLIEDDKVLFSCTITQNLVITDLTGKILWQLNTSEAYYRANHIPSTDIENIHGVDF